MYGKLFAQMYDGTLGTEGPWEALVTFQQMIILADQDGVVDMTAEALSRRTTIPLRVIKKGLQALEAPDSGSRSPDEGGRRILRLSESRDWGWRLVNHTKYRAIRTTEERRQYQREYWHKRKGDSTPLNNSTGTQPNQPIAEAYTEAKAEAEAPSVPSLRSGTGRKRPSDPMSDAVWGEGTALLGEAKDARSFLGKLCKEYGQRLVLQAISDAQSAIPAEPRAWLVARCQERRAISGNRQVALEERNAAIAANWHPPEDE